MLKLEKKEFKNFLEKNENNKYKIFLFYVSKSPEKLENIGFQGMKKLISYYNSSNVYLSMQLRLCYFFCLISTKISGIVRIIHEKLLNYNGRYGSDCFLGEICILCSLYVFLCLLR